MKKLLVVGAGPKALALLTKARCLRESGWGEVPQIVVLERKRTAGANWSGAGGYTDGTPHLDTPPEKDLGFPYGTEYDNDRSLVSTGMLRYSWTNFLVGTGQIADWVDRG